MLKWPPMRVENSANHCLDSPMTPHQQGGLTQSPDSMDRSSQLLLMEPTRTHTSTNGRETEGTTPHSSDGNTSS